MSIFSIVSLVSLQLWYFNVYISLSAATSKYLDSTATNSGTWYEAQTYCQSQGTTLASIHSLEDFNLAKAKCNELVAGSYGCWIGLNNIDVDSEWVWSDDTISDYGFTNNNPSSPTDATSPWLGIQTPSQAGPDSCAIMRLGQYYHLRWAAWSCSSPSTAYPICNAPKPPPPPPSKYLDSTAPNSGTWYEAQTYCESQQTTLASIHSLDDYNLAKAKCNELVAGSYGCWIGLNKIDVDSEWVWSDNTISDYGFTNDNPSSPTDTGPWCTAASQAGPDSCALMQLGGAYQLRWNVWGCSNPRTAYPICNAPRISAKSEGIIMDKPKEDINIKLSTRDMYMFGTVLAVFNLLFIGMAVLVILKCCNGCISETYQYKPVKFDASDSDVENINNK